MFDENSFSPFYQSFLSLCSQKGVNPSVAARDAGISSGAPTAWKKGAIPKPAQREKLCNYFGVTDEVLLGYGREKNMSAIHTDSGQVRLENTYLRLAQGAQELGMDDEDVDAILAIYAKHKQRNQ